jgi:hypothetical protein
MSKTAIIATEKFCDFCSVMGNRVTASYDARITKGNHAGSWANMCLAHWNILTGKQLGTGFGQRLLLEVPMKATEPNETACEECWPSKCDCI